MAHESWVKIKNEKKQNLKFETLGGTGGNMQIGNIHWKQIRLETSFQIGNKKSTWETNFLDWKHYSQIGNSEFRLETKFVDWKHVSKNATQML